MKRLFVLGLLAALGACGGRDSLAIDTPATLRGTVIDAGTAQGIAGALVQVQSQQTTTDASGAYEFTNLVNGPTTLEVTANGYVAFSQSIVLIPGDNQRDVSMSLTTSGGPTPAVLRGQVTETGTGTPLPAIFVRAQAASTLTDATGNYTLTGLTSGQATVEAQGIGYEFFSTTLPLDTGDNQLDMQLTPIVTPPAGALDPYLPPSWTDTIHHDGFATPISQDAANCVGGCANEGQNGAYTVIVSQPNMVHGGRISGFTPANRLVDTFTVSFAGDVAPNFWWEGSHEQTTGGGSVRWHFDFADGNGSANTNVDRVYIRLSMFFEEAGTATGVNDYGFNNSSNKMVSLNGVAEPWLWQRWDGLVALIDLTGRNKPPAVGADCPHYWPNTWHLYYPADTLAFWKRTSCRGGALGNTPAGNATLEIGRVQHWWVCLDSSPPDGQEIISWGVTEENRQGIAGYWNTVDIDNGWHSVYRNTTWGGGPGVPGDQSQWTGEMLIVSGNTGSCIVPS